jgi:hypothetical protein
MDIQEEDKEARIVLFVKIFVILGIIIALGVTLKSVFDKMALKYWAGKQSENPNNKPGTPGYDPTKQTLSDNELKAIAQLINDSVHWYGDSSKDVLTALSKLNNDADMLQLINIFGQAQIGGTGGKLGFNLGQFIDNHYAKDVDSFNAALAAKGITRTV